MNGTTTYPTYDAAYRRMQAILRQHGVWTGIHGVPDGWQLGHDPDEVPDGNADDGKGET